MRVLLDQRLASWGATLDGESYDDVLTYLLDTCWELAGTGSGDEGIPRRCGCGCRATLRHGWRVRAYTDVEEIDAGDDAEELGWFPRRADAELAADERFARDANVILEIVESPPPGAYDPTLGLSFSTYSRRILQLRVADWYRKTFGDSRYGGKRIHVSLDAVAERYDAEGEAPEQFLEALLPATNDPLDDVLTHVALGR